MKKLSAIIAAILLMVGTVFAQTTTDLSLAIDKSAKEISSVLPSKSKIAVVSFFSDSKELSSYISQEMVKKLTQRSVLTVLERNERNMSLVDAEQEYQFSGNVRDDSMVELGYKLGAQYLVYGAFDQFGGMLQLTIQVTNVESAEIPYMTSYTITKTTQITDLLGDDMELNSAEDYLNAIARCQRKITSIEREKSKNIQNTSSKINAKYQNEINEIRAQEKDPWESTDEYNTRINKAVNDVVQKRDTELNGVEKSAGINYDNQSKQVEIQKDKLIKDLQNTTFILKGDSVQVLLGTFDPEAKPKNWPVSIKSLDKQVAYTYNGKYVVNDADVKTEYKVVEAARAANDFEGEISYRIIEGNSKNAFDVYVVSVRVYIRSSASTILNESINKTVGNLNANKTVSGKSGYNTSVTETKPTTTETIKPVTENKPQAKTTTNTVKTDVERGTNTGKSASGSNKNKEFEPLSISNWNANKDKGTLVIRNQEVNHEGKTYKCLTIVAETQNATYSEVYCEVPEMKKFIVKGDTIKFKCIGDGKDWNLSFRLYNGYPNNTDYNYVFHTKKGKVVEVEIPYTKMTWANWSKNRKFNKNEVVSISFNVPNLPSSVSQSIQIFDVRVY